MYELVNKGIEDGQKFVTYVDKSTGVKNTYYESEIDSVEDQKLKMFLKDHK